MGSNVKSNIWLCALAIPQMAERGNGSVVIISSIGGLRGSTVIGAYGISKAADFALCRSLAGEWGPKGVRVNCVAPGLVKTDFARALWEDPENLKRRTATTPLRRIGEPDEIAGAVAYLGVRRLDLHDRPDHRGRRRRDDGGDVDFASSLPLRGGWREANARRGDARSALMPASLGPSRVCISRAPLARRSHRRALTAPPSPQGAREADRAADIDLPPPNPLCLSRTPQNLPGRRNVMSFVLAIDQGTTSSRAIIFDAGDICIAGTTQQEFPQITPPPAGSSTTRRRSGARASGACRAAFRKAGVTEGIAAIGITNQRETTVVWDRATGQGHAQAIVWQDRRTAGSATS